VVQRADERDPKRQQAPTWGRTVALTLVFLVAMGSAGAVPPVPIPQDGTPAKRFIGHAAKPRPVKTFRVPRHPFMAPNGDSNIHNDAYMTDAYTRRGPLGRRMKVTSTFLSADCASVSFDRRGRIVTICVGVDGPKLVLMRPRTLETLAVMELPPRSSSGTGSTPFNDFANGGYFYLDHRGRSVLPTNTRQVWVVDHKRLGPGDFTFEVVRRYDLVTEMQPNEGIVSILPDWKGRIWFVTTRGLVGYIRRHSGRVAAVRLDDEVIANSFAVDETGGVFIVSDHALYRFETGKKGPRVMWRQRYDRGSRVKPGQVSQGSGTTPTLIGRRFVAITDNADPRMKVIVYRRGRRTGSGRKICSEPVFKKRRSATDNSLIAVGRSLIVENNYGYSGPAATTDGKSTYPGLARVSFTPKGSCRTRWVSNERAPTVVPKASATTGLVYAYTKPRRSDGEDPWYFTALSFRTGRTIYKRLAGEGLGFNNNYAPITIDPKGRAYVGALGGLVQLRDRRD
jgi:hypothetical protein